MSVSDAGDITPYKALQWSLEEKFNVGESVTVRVLLPDKPSEEALDRLWGRMIEVSTVCLSWNPPTLEITLKRPPRSANLADVLEKAVGELGMLAMRLGYR